MLICEFYPNLRMSIPYHLSVLISAFWLPVEFPRSYTWQVMDQQSDLPDKSCCFLY